MDAVYVKRFVHTGRIRRPACELGIVRRDRDEIEFETTIFYNERGSRIHAYKPPGHPTEGEDS